MARFSPCLSRQPNRQALMNVHIGRERANTTKTSSTDRAKGKKNILWSNTYFAIIETAVTRQVDGSHLSSISFYRHHLCAGRDAACSYCCTIYNIDMID